MLRSVSLWTASAAASPSHLLPLHCLSCAEMGDLDDYQRAMLTAHNKLLQTVKVAVATLHHGNEISMQLHRDLREVTPPRSLEEALLQAVAA